MALTKVVGSGFPVHRTTELAVKAEPFTVKVKAAPPACAVEGFRLVMTGSGFVPATLIVNVTPFEAAPLVLTVTVAVPDTAMKPEETGADN